MVKVCEEEFPLGSYPGQMTAGFALDKLVKVNLDVLARSIVKDMQFVGIISGNGTVRNGKSTLAQQVGFYFTNKVNNIHKVNNSFTCNNIVFNADDLMDRAFSLPKYSCIVLDEGDDLTGHHFSKLTQKLNRFFRKCGQLNLFVILIIPDFFELPRPYAITRTNFLINVKFFEEFERGLYDFYSAKNKRDLYIRGRRYGDYSASKPNIPKARFGLPYTVDEKEYRRMKLEDLERQDKEDMKKEIERKSKLIKAFCNIRFTFPEKKVEDICKWFDISRKTGYNWLNDAKTMGWV